MIPKNFSRLKLEDPNEKVRKKDSGSKTREYLDLHQHVTCKTAMISTKGQPFLLVKTF